MKNNLTISEYEKYIKEKYGAKRIEIDYFYSHLSEFIFERIGLEDIKGWTISKLIDVFTEIKVKDEWLYALYLIPVLKDENKTFEGYFKEQLVAIFSDDGVRVYFAGVLSRCAYLSHNNFYALDEELFSGIDGVDYYAPLEDE